MKYLFTLGHQPHISAAEIQQILKLEIRNLPAGQAGWKLENGLLHIELDHEIDCTALMQRLGGTISISEHLGQAENVVSFLVSHIQKLQPEGKIHFSVHGDNAKQTALKVKKELKSTGRSVRYIEEKNSATVLHNNLVEKQTDFTVLKKDVFVTRAIQPLEEFSSRDYGKPGADSKSGMLPPKLARMMINLSGIEKGTLLDPFCGSGVLLMEAALLGFKAMGSDISEKAVEDTKKNLDWIEKEGKVVKSDVKNLSSTVKEMVDVIVTEPYMGKPLHGNEKEDFLRGQAVELKGLYVDAFRNFSKILKNDGVVVFIIPKFQYNEGWIEIDCIEDIKNQGFAIEPFSKENSSLLYHRSGQKVGRDIWRFVKKG